MEIFDYIEEIELYNDYMTIVICQIRIILHCSRSSGGPLQLCRNRVNE